MKIFYATWLFDVSLGRSLTKKKANSRLISYHFVKIAKTTNEQLADYCKLGRLNPKKK